jgi:CRP-like cAMP-binding protein
MQDGSAIEVANVGSEGIVGLHVGHRLQRSFAQMIVQIPGTALRMDVALLQQQACYPGAWQQLVLCAQAAFLTRVLQGAACHALHTLQQRCVRWLLEALDRVEAEDLPVTQAALAQLLGVRRAGVCAALHTLQTAGLIRCQRGRVRVLDRGGLELACCECYRVVQAECARLLGDSS